MNPSRISVWYEDGDRDAGIAVVMPSIASRANNGLRDRAVMSVHRQTLHPIELHVAVDYNHDGAAATRQHALDAVSPDAKLVAFLDDDDTWYPHHLATQYGLICRGWGDGEPADVAYSWFDGNDPFPMHRGRRWNPSDEHHLTMTIMVRAELAKKVGFHNHTEASPEWPGEDWAFIQKLNALNARFAGTGEVTWTYQVHEGNTSGLGSRW